MTKTNIIKPLLFLFGFLCLCLPVAFAIPVAEVLQTDSLSVATPDHLPVVRQISAESLEELKEDAAMDYYLASPDDNLWVMFRNWLFVQLLRLFGSPEAISALELTVYTICLIALVYIVLRLMNVDLSGLLINNKRRAVVREDAISPDEDIHTIDFQAAVAEALKNGEYSKAVRLLYLSSLKELSDRGHIRWQAGKTNYQYQQELQQKELQLPFLQLGHLFEWAWYGGFPVGEGQYKKAAQFYRMLKQQIKQTA
jgi:hypothetical protein